MLIFAWSPVYFNFTQRLFNEFYVWWCPPLTLSLFLSYWVCICGSVLFLLPSMPVLCVCSFYADAEPSVVATKNCLQISLDCILEHEIFLISLFAI